MLRRVWNGWTYWFGREGLRSPFMLTALVWINLLGTIYGYYWYKGQLQDTLALHPAWMSFLVPDSPTASLFFTAAIWWLYKVPDREGSAKGIQAVRSFVETFAVVTSFKYGVWAVSIIFAGYAQGDPLSWQDWMLSASHLGMAVEALLYAGFFRISAASTVAVAAWTLYNDYADYGFGIFPYLPRNLWDDVGGVEAFTIALSFISLVLAWTTGRLFRKSPV